MLDRVVPVRARNTQMDPSNSQDIGIPTGPLAGVKIIDLTSVLFGPYASQILGDWGADVIKVESLGGDIWRYAGQFRNRGMSGQFMAVNRNKRSVAVDLKTDRGKKILQELLQSADALVTNVRPAALDRLGFGYDRCHASNPKLIYAVATGFGQDGPWAARPAFDEIIQAASGLASSIGTDDEPAFVPSLIGDKVCGLMLAAAVSAALFRRERSGEGQLVEVPMLETVAAFNSIEMMGGHAFEPPIGPPGYNRMKERRPVKTKDGWLTMLPYSADNWCHFFEAVERPQLIELFSIRDPVLRSANIDRIYAAMAEIAAEKTTAEWEDLLLRIDVPHAPFATMAAIDKQQHLESVGLFRRVDHPSEGRVIQARPPARFSSDPAGMHRVAPTLGQHTREVLEQLGYSAAQIDRLVDDEIVSAVG